MRRGQRSLRVYSSWLVLMVTGFWIGSVCAAEYSELHFSKGVLSFNEKKFEEALQELTRAAELEPQDAETQYFLGLAHSRLKSFPSAVAAFKRALELDSSLDKVHYDLGVAYFNLGDYSLAIRELQLAESYEPNRAMVPFFLGYSYYLTEEFDRCLPYFKRAGELDPTLVQSANFFSGMAHWNLERFDEAEEAFHTVVETDPKTELALAAGRYIESIGERKRLAKRWSLRTNLGLQYDDNVNLEPSESIALPRGLNEDEEDFRPAFFLTGEYKLLEGLGWESAIRYNFYQSIHSNLHDFDYQNHRGIFSVSRRGKVWEMPYQLYLDYGYSHGLLGAARYLERHGVGATFNLLKGSRYLTQLQYRFQNRDFHFETFSSPYNRDSDNNSLGLTQFIFSADRTRYLKLGYAFDEDHAKGDNWDYQGHRLLFGLRSPIWKALGFSVEVEYHPQDYSHSHTFFQKKRRDKEHTYSLGLEWALRRGGLLSFQYLRRNHDSGIALYEYERDIFSIGLSLGF